MDHPPPGRGAEGVERTAAELAPLVGEALAHPGWLPRLPAALADRQRADTGAERRRYIQVVSLIGILVYDAFIPVDRMILSDVFPVLLLIKLFLMTPSALGVVLIGAVRPTLLPPWLMEWLLAAFIQGAALVLAAAYWSSASPLAVAYRDMMMLYIVFANVIARVPFVHAVSGTALILAVQAADLVTSPEIPFELRVFHLSLCAIVAAYTLFANAAFARQERQSYLLALREALRGSDLAARNTYLAGLSATDGLTGVANRREWDQRLAAALAKAGAAPLCVLMADIDHFKRFNGTHGHAAGDACLRSVARTLSEHLRGGSDLVARYGREEFCILLPATPLAAAVEIAERMRAAVAASSPGAVTLSIGVAQAIAAQGDTPEQTLRRADVALYEAKRGGRDAVRPASAMGRRAEVAA